MTKTYPRKQRRAAWLELLGHATRNPQMFKSEGESRHVRRQKARDFWRESVEHEISPE